MAAREARGATRAVLGALTLLYMAQGVPFGLAAEYLPVVLREMGATRAHIAAAGWLQLPWQLKPLWASVADHPAVRPRSRAILLGLQLLLALTMAAYGLFPERGSLAPWLVITAVAALIASTQDIFVDAFAVRSLDESSRGYGNSAQIAGYRVGIILGGGGLLLLAGHIGASVGVLVCAAVILAAGVGAFALRDDEPVDQAPKDEGPYRTATRPTVAVMAAGFWRSLKQVFHRDTWRVAAMAVTYKLGAHAASGLIKPMLVDLHWTRDQIGGPIVTAGTLLALTGSVAGGAVHRTLGERRALIAGMFVHAAATLPLVALDRMGCPPRLTIAAVALEHAASGMGTTVLFAALMSATRRDMAASHYATLTSLNALAIGIGTLIGALIADTAGNAAGFLCAAALCLAPLALMPGWARHVGASAGATNT